MKKPNHYFKSIHEAGFRGIEKPQKEPDETEFLCMWTGETIKHSQGTVFWDYSSNCFNIQSLMYKGITHFRVLKE